MKEEAHLDRRGATIVGHARIDEMVPDEWERDRAEGNLETQQCATLDETKGPGSSVLTCAAAAKVIAHGKVQPLAWNIGSTLEDGIHIILHSAERGIWRAYHRYVESYLMLRCS